MSVNRAQRFTRARPCPVCGGGDDDLRGVGRRCAGYRLRDGVAVVCTREEYAGSLERSDRVAGYIHATDLYCQCGTDHRSDAPAPAANDGKPGRPASRIVVEYEFRDERRELLYVVERRDPKAFPQRRPDGRGGWIWNLDGVRRVLYRLPELIAEMKAHPPGERVVYVPEGEKDADALRALGLSATTNAGGAGKWRDEYTSQLRAAGVERVVILPDNDRPGEAHAQSVARSCLATGFEVKIARLSALPPKGDVSDWLDQGHTNDELPEIIKATPLLDVGALAGDPGAKSPPRSSSPWSAARSAPDFLADDGGEREDWIDRPLLAREAITHIFAPRGVGKSLVCLSTAVKVARAGVRVLYLDRDNPPRQVRKRLRGFGASEAPALRVMVRHGVPPLTDTRAWEAFPWQDYDVVVIDSFDSATEGVGEDSGPTAKAIAPILDIARRAGGPAFLIPGNTTKSGAHGRGSGVVEDRADIVFEVRDATDFRPTGGRDWWLELPPAGREAWGERAARRKKRTTYRLAFIASKFRGDSEPDPFMLAVDLSGEVWTVRDCSADVVAAGETAQEQARHEEAAKVKQAIAALVAEVERRASTDEDLLLKTGAEEFLKAHGVTRKTARELLVARAGTAWQLNPRDGRGMELVPVSPVSIQAAAGSAPAETPRQTAIFEGENAAARMDTERQNLSMPGPASMAGIRATQMPPPSSLDSDEEVL